MQGVERRQSNAKPSHYSPLTKLPRTLSRRILQNLCVNITVLKLEREDFCILELDTVQAGINVPIFSVTSCPPHALQDVKLQKTATFTVFAKSAPNLIFSPTFATSLSALYRTRYH